MRAAGRDAGCRVGRSECASRAGQAVRLNLGIRRPRPPSAATAVGKARGFPRCPWSLTHSEMRAQRRSASRGVWVARYRTCRTVLAAQVFTEATHAANMLLIIDLHARRRAWAPRPPPRPTPPSAGRPPSDFARGSCSVPCRHNLQRCGALKSPASWDLRQSFFPTPIAFSRRLIESLSKPSM